MLKKTKTMKQPHDNWATFYDCVYEKTFGPFYNSLTSQTLNVINSILTNGTIIDYGAGTGRLTIPLRDQDYEIVAVEKSAGMVGELIKKRTNLSLDFQIHNCSISEYANGNCDLALALFTVLSYSVTEEELSRNIKTICKHIHPNGHFFFDLPNMIFFTGNHLPNIQTKNFNRIVELTSNNENDIYTYKENCSGIYNGQEFSYEDEFRIRYWTLNTLDKLLSENGFIDTNKSFTQFNSTGSTYKLYQRQ